MQKQIVRRPYLNDNHLPNHLHPLIKQIYASRGIKNERELELKVSQLCAIESLKGINQGCQVLHQALIENKNIAIIGDFDADGATSTALMMEALRLFGSDNYQFLVPNRFLYGYGLTPEIVEIAAKQGAELLITVDNGISCVAGVAKAKSLDLSVIVTDHHLPGMTLPDADAIINPNQVGCNFPSKALAGVGVAFYFMMAMRKYLREKNWFVDKKIAEPNIAQLLDLVALGTVADVVSLDNNNRILVEQGLKRIRAGVTRPGIQALLEIAGKDQKRIVASDFGFALGPRINAAGRLDDMSYGINCLLAKDLTSARVMAADLDDLNKSRREIEQGMQQEAEQVLKSLNFSDDNLPHAISLFQRDWHQGVIGIVAGRLKEKFHRPSIVFAGTSDDLSPDKSGKVSEIKGSARSIPGLHIRDLLEHLDTQHPNIIIKFGGHAMAAGLSIAEDNFEKFQQLFNQYAELWLSSDDLKGTLSSDGELPVNQMTLSFAQLLRDSGPWGQNFIEPLFDDKFTLVQQRIVGHKHLKLVVEKEGQVFDAIAFNVDLTRWPDHKTQQVHLAYRLDINEFRGKQSVQFIVEYLA
ncbi:MULTISPECIES: single-stranded-DNA-specific exonuclease RecJ [unclassified Colwellia]|uniref:single-stranded-DNA-specific exonuclease RecJ n=1 Tax=unclassified Colwellia TaxID=196834 RepID=UPI0015F53A8C|nr:MULTISPECIES: single-stranded-DNA-specific exonuclease RecJ [unclassified Colwellia]MBA6230808.1 single-stranded-DNA-specific exonuclease RecJ [Colwellia sp. MB02u-7]MBA6234739.1 single-stranded-DNA-specific exonuclease RecJ [Colwellia sp. MB02u-11]MBA6255602.1 single-stranded-DNA-specific exonuclease RecJ [Colwellia sp. MB3u-28]MBA6261743.1 single-stranded-DNA-specific exonuclease RecJ [Colwellia sp. MB3u-41]MBA6301294.1 single-stranded-DNA-specific exonuclease RecJ [Colwellia sp. MB3u-22]